MSRDLSLYDSGELALAARTLGLGHPPGQPLHTLLGYLFSLIGAQPLVGINFLSALPAALSLVPAARIASALTPPDSKSAASRAWQPFLLGLFALHESVWEPATRVEVYALATLFALWAVALGMSIAAPVGPSSNDDTPQAPSLGRRVFGIGLLLGLSASANPVIAAATGCALLPSLARVAWREGGTRKLVGLGILGCVLGLLPYAYLPIAASYSQALIWGGLDTADSYVHYLTLRDYTHNQGIGLHAFFDHIAAWGEWALEHMLAPVLILGLGGFVRARSLHVSARWVFPLAGAALLANVSFNVVWDLAVPDYNGYLALAYWLSAAGATALCASCLDERRWVAVASVTCCLLAGWICTPAPWTRTRHQDQLARTLAERVLHEAPTNAIVISSLDYFAGSLFYLQQAERQRPDVVVLAYGLASSDWHWQHLYKTHPALVPTPLRGGTRAARVRRFLDANTARPVLIENLELAHHLGLRACAGGLYFRSGDACKGTARPDDAVTALLAREQRRVRDGSPSAADAIAEVSAQLGLTWWQLGWPREAHAMLLAGVPSDALPHGIGSNRTPALLASVHTSVREPIWNRHAALGDPARNLFLAGAIVHASGQSQLALSYLRAAARLGLPEAQHILNH